VPRVSFNGALGAGRVFATHTLPLGDIKKVRQEQGVTVNNVVLAVVSGALRRWLTASGERPRSSLVAAVPVATDPPDSPPRLGGNRVSNLFTTLATDVEDPRERLQQISRTTAEAKLVHRTLGVDMLSDWVQFTPPAPMTAFMRGYSRSKAASRHPAPCNLIVSNVPGPRQEATVAGARLTDLFSVGPILEGMGLNVTAWSYVDRMNFSLLSCPDLIADLAPLVRELRPALDELLAMESREIVEAR
jgi:diacylglycerol O-acyltransferase